MNQKGNHSEILKTSHKGIVDIPLYDHMNFLSKIIINSETECWEWNKSLDKDGYGIYGPRINGKKFRLRVHRLSIDMFKEKLKEYFVVDHICRNRKCLNPDHLRQVSVTENTLFNSNAPWAIQKLQTHCKNNHELSNDNIYVYGNSRKCKTCIKNRKNK